RGSSLDRMQREGTVDRGDVVDVLQAGFDEAVIGFEVVDLDPQEIIALPCHQEAFLDLGALAHRLFEGGDGRGLMIAEPHLHESCDLAPELAHVELRLVADDQALRLETLPAPEAWRL